MCTMRNVIEIHVPNKKNFKFGLWASYKPTPIPYENMLTYIPVLFLFSFKKKVRVRVKTRVRVSFRVRVRDR